MFGFFHQGYESECMTCPYKNASNRNNNCTEDFQPTREQREMQQLQEEKERIRQIDHGIVNLPKKEEW